MMKGLLMVKRTFADFHEMLVRIEEKQSSIIEKIDDIKIWQREHQENDIRQFKELGETLIAIRTYASALVIGISFIGACIKWFF